MIKQALQMGGYIILAMIAGMLTGVLSDTGSLINLAVDYLILALVFMVLLDAPLNKMLIAVKQPKLLAICWFSNFVIIPVLGFFLTRYLLVDKPLVAIGLAIYFMFPCTDWFLGFTRMANGNTGLGSVLLPINMLTQLLLYPIYLQLIAQQAIADISFQEIVTTLTDWFLLPAVLAFMIRCLAARFKIHIQPFLSKPTNGIIYALVFAIFAVNVNQIVDNYSVFALILLAVSAFFILTTFITEIIAKLFALNYENHVLYSMTTTARNAPLMLGLTMSVLPNQPMIYTAIIIGMLIEFPYLAFQVIRLRLKTQNNMALSKLHTLLSSE